MPNRDRLTRLSEVLQEGRDANKFFNSDWWQSCVCGWAIDSGIFTNEGLRRRSSGNADPCYNAMTGFIALRKFFGLTLDEAMYIFGTKQSQSGPDNVDVAITRISELLSKYESFWVWFPAKLGLRR